MSQPTAYTRQFSFVDHASSNPSDPLPGNQVDAELNAVKTTLDEALTNLALLQRDDTALKNSIVHPDSFTTASLALIASDWTPRGLWVTATAYVVGDVVEESGTAYVCAVAHTSGTFSTDHTAGKWIVLSSSAASSAFTPAGDIAATTVQAAIEELDDEKQPLDPTLTALAALTTAADKLIYATGADTFSTASLTAAGRAILDDADADAQRTTLAAAGLADANTFTGINTFSAQARWKKGGDIASAAPLVLGTDGNYFDVTGTTGFSAITVAAGTLFMLQFDGALTITHGSGITLPGAANITTAAGDHLIGFATAANTVFALAYTKASGKPVVGTVLQVQSDAIAAASGTTAIPADNTAPLISEGTEIASVAITPASTSSKVLVQASVLIDSASSQIVSVALFRGSTCIGATQRNGTVVLSLALSVLDSPASASEVTYSLRIGNTDGSTIWYASQTNADTYGGAPANSTLTAMEIAA